MAQGARERVASLGRTVRERGAGFHDRSGLVGRSVDAATPDVDGFVRFRRAERCDVEARRTGGVDGRFDDGDVLAGYERNDVRGDDLVGDLDREEPEGGNVLRRDDPNGRAGHGHDGPGTDATLAVG